jgi:predicted RNA binding protein YcfA (HicA-like mRNA interferase family)
VNLSPWHLIKLLEQHGFINTRNRGSHYIFYNSTSKKTVSVPVHGSRDLRKGTFLAILKQAGIDKKITDH